MAALRSRSQRISPHSQRIKASEGAYVHPAPTTVSSSWPSVGEKRMPSQEDWVLAHGYELAEPSIDGGAVAGFDTNDHLANAQPSRR